MVKNNIFKSKIFSRTKIPFLMFRFSCIFSSKSVFGDFGRITNTGVGLFGVVNSGE